MKVVIFLFCINIFSFQNDIKENKILIENIGETDCYIFPISLSKTTHNEDGTINFIFNDSTYNVMCNSVNKFLEHSKCDESKKFGCYKVTIFFENGEKSIRYLNRDKSMEFFQLMINIVENKDLIELLRILYNRNDHARHKTF